jgi:hypothetical protein
MLKSHSSRTLKGTSSYKNLHPGNQLTGFHGDDFSVTCEQDRQSACNGSHCLFACGFYFSFYPEDGGNTFLRNVG